MESADPARRTPPATRASRTAHSSALSATKAANVLPCSRSSRSPAPPFVKQSGSRCSSAVRRKSNLATGGLQGGVMQVWLDEGRALTSCLVSFHWREDLRPEEEVRSGPRANRDVSGSWASRRDFQTVYKTEGFEPPTLRFEESQAPEGAREARINTTPRGSQGSGPQGRAVGGRRGVGLAEGHPDEGSREVVSRSRRRAQSPHSMRLMISSCASSLSSVKSAE